MVGIVHYSKEDFIYTLQLVIIPLSVTMSTFLYNLTLYKRSRFFENLIDRPTDIGVPDYLKSIIRYVS